MIQECHFTSYKHLWAYFGLAKGTYLRILHDVLLLKKVNLQWISHSLDNTQNAEWVSLAETCWKF
jgi:hypothetical protein